MDLRNRTIKEQTTRHSSSSKLKNFFRIIAIIIVVGLLSGTFVLYRMYSGYQDALDSINSESTEVVAFKIEQGESIDSIISRLVENDLLAAEYEDYFRFYLNQSNKGASIQAGSFRIPQNLTMVELADTLQQAGVPDVWVTLPEGLRADEIAATIGAEYANYDEAVFDETRFMALVSDPEFASQYNLVEEPVNTLEGFLYPDKYLLPVEATEEYVIEVMVQTFISRYGDSGLTYQDVILASMLEREGRNDTERAMIADIINRRHDEGWLLNIDATLLYYVGDWKHTLTAQDLETDHPYNTYTRTGFPPTPIANPGKSSLDAALNPTPNDYYFYLHDPSGQIHYAIDYAGHNQNINQYLR